MNSSDASDNAVAAAVEAHPADTAVGEKSPLQGQSSSGLALAAEVEVHNPASLDNLPLKQLHTDDLQLVCNDFAEYLIVDSTADVNAVLAAIEDMLFRIDEFRGVVDTITENAVSAVETNVPALNSKAQRLEEVFRKIDMLEKHMDAVKLAATDIDHRLDVAERDHQQKSIKKAFSTFQRLPFFSKNTTLEAEEKARLERLAKKWVPPPLINTDDYFDAELAEKERAAYEFSGSERTNDSTQQ